MSASTVYWRRYDAGNFFVEKGAPPWGGTTIRNRYLDLTLTTADSAVQTAIMKIPAGAYLKRVQVIGRTGENLTLSLGDSDAGTTFLTTASQSTAAVQTAWTTGKYYASADEINMTWSNAASNFKGFVVAEFAILSTKGD